MSWGKKLASVFMEMPEEKEEEKQVPRPAQPSSSGTVQVPSQPVAYQPQNQPSVNYALQNPVVDSKFRAQLEKLLADANLAGIDFFEFMNAVKATANIPGFPEQMRYVSAFATLKSTSVDLDKNYLLKTADHYIDVLTKEEGGFDVEMQKVVDQKVVGLQNQAKNVEVEVQKKREELIKIQADIENMQTEINKLHMQAQDAHTQINFKAQEFKASVVGLKNELEQYKQSINTYIA